MTEEVIPKVLVRRRRRWIRAAFDRIAQAGGMTSTNPPSGGSASYFGGRYFGREYYGKEFFG